MPPVVKGVIIPTVSHQIALNLELKITRLYTGLLGSSVCSTVAVVSVQKGH